MNSFKAVLLSAIFAIFSVPSAIAGTNAYLYAPSPVISGTSYTVYASGVFDDEYACDGGVDLYRNNSHEMSAYGTWEASVQASYTDTGTQNIGYDAYAYAYYGGSAWVHRDVQILPGSQPAAMVFVDGYASGATITRPWHGSVTITVRYRAINASGNITGIRPQIWKPSGELDNNGGVFVPQSGSSGEVVRTVTLDANGAWRFWTDAQDSQLAATGSYVDSGSWNSGFLVNVVEGKGPPPVATVSVDGYSSGQTIVWYYGTPYPTVTVHCRATDVDGNLTGICPRRECWWVETTEDENGFHSETKYFIDNNGGAYVGQSGSSGEVVRTFTLDAARDWYLGATAIDADGQVADSGAGTNGFKLTVEARYNNPPRISVNAPPAVIRFGESIDLASTATDADQNMTNHMFWRRGPRGADTFGQDWNGWQNYWENSSDWSNWSNPGSATGPGGSNISARFTPPAPGYWQFHANAWDSLGAWGSGATTTAVFVAPAPTATISASATNGAQASGGGTLTMTVGNTVTLISTATAAGWLSEHNIFGYTNPNDPGSSFFSPGGGQAGLDGNGATTVSNRSITWTPSTPGTYVLYTEAFTGRSAYDRINGTSGWPGYFDGSANKRITIIVTSVPTTFSVGDFTYDGAQKNVTITPNPANATFVSGGTLTATGAGAYTATAVATGNYSGSNYNLQWNIRPANQATLTINASQIQTYGTIQTLGTSGGSGTGAVSYNIVNQSASGVATLRGATLTSNTGSGWVDVQATKASDNNYNATTSATLRVTFQKASQAALSLSVASTQTYNTSQTLGVTGGSCGGGVSYRIVNQSSSGIASLVDSTLTANSGTGWVDVQASKDGDANYYPVTSQVVRIYFQKANQAALSIIANTSQLFDTTQMLGVGGGSCGGAVNLRITAQSKENAASLSGASLKANTGSGWVEVQASKDGDNNFNAVASAVLHIDFKRAPMPTPVPTFQTTQAYGTTQEVPCYLILNELSSPGVMSIWETGDNPNTPDEEETHRYITANSGTGWAKVQIFNQGDADHETTIADVIITLTKLDQNVSITGLSTPVVAGIPYTLSKVGGVVPGDVVWGGTAGVSGTGDTKTITFNTPGTYTVTATVPGNDNYKPGIATVTFRAYGISEDTDHDGIPDWWEVANRLDPNEPSDAAAHPEGSSYTYAEHYNLSLPLIGDDERNSQRLENKTDLDRAYLDVSVIAKGSGTVTLTCRDENNNVVGDSKTFQFTANSNNWVTVPSWELLCYVGAGYHVTATSSGVSDFVVSAKFSKKSSPLLGATIEFNGTYSDRLERAKISGDEFTLRLVPTKQSAFGAMDTSELYSARRLSFGLGKNASGQTAGAILCTITGVFGGGASAARIDIIKGPALEWTHRTATHFQGKAPSGLVDVVQAHGLWTVRFYTTGSYPEVDGFKDFTGTAPLSTYEVNFVYKLPSDQTKGASITQSIGGQTLKMEAEWGDNTYELISENKGADEDPITNIYQAKGITRLSEWRVPGTPQRSLTKIVARKNWMEIIYPSHVRSVAGGDIYIDTTQYKGASETAAVGFSTHEVFDGSDYCVALKQSETRGEPGEVMLNTEHRVQQFYVRAAVLKPAMTYIYYPSVNGYDSGSCEFTEYYGVNDVAGRVTETNLEGQSMMAVGEIKKVWRTLGNATPSVTVTYNPTLYFPINTIITSSAPVTTYTYYQDPVDGRAAVEKAITKVGETPAGHSEYVYATGQFGGKDMITTTETAYAAAENALTTTSKYYSRRLTDLDYRSKPISIQKPDGTKTSYVYQRGTFSGDAWSADSTGTYLLVAELNGKAGSGVSTFSGVPIDPLDMDTAADRSIATERILTAEGLVKRESNYVYSGGSFTLLQRVHYSYDALGNLTSKTDSSGRILYEAHYNGFRKDWEKDEQGIKLSYTYDNYGHTWTMTREAAAYGGNTIAQTVTTYNYDEIGQLKTETVSAAGETSLVTSYTFDTAGRPKSRTLPGDLTTSTVYNSYFQTTTTLPGEGTKVESLYPDGRLHSVTGSAVPDTTYAYAYDATSGNFKTTQTTVGQTSTTETDWLGRTVSVTTATWGDGVTAGNRTTTNHYNSIGQLASQTVESGDAQITPAHLYEYDDFGALKREAIDTNGDSTINNATDSAVKEYEYAYQTGAPGYASSSALYRYDGVKVWPYDGTTASTSRYASQTYTQVTGFSSSTVAHSVALDFDHNKADTITTVDRATKLLTSTTTANGTSQALSQVSLNGLPIKSINAQGQTTLMTYDGLGRLESSTDPRIGTTSCTYKEGTVLVETTTTPDLHETTLGYDDAGHVTSKVDQTGKTAYFKYDVVGNLTHQWGDTVNPVRYEYNELGQKTKMHTYRTGTWTGSALPADFSLAGDVTTWSYQDATGLLQSKTDADSRTTSYTYNALGQIKQRADARLVHTTYNYNALNLLWTVTYDDGVTTNLTYTYDRSGRQTTVTDAAGQRSFDYYDTSTDLGDESDLLNKSARLKNENLPTFLGGHVLTHSYQYGVSGRVNGVLSGLKLDSGTLYNVTYDYDAVLRLNSVAYNSLTPFTYNYTDNSNLVATVEQLTSPSTWNYSRDYTYRADSNRIDQLTHAWGTSNQITTRLTYYGLDGIETANSFGLRATEKTSGAAYSNLLQLAGGLGSYTNYSYSDRAELSTSCKFQLNADSSAGEAQANAARNYVMDAMGNRTADQYGSYTPNKLNQYDATPFGSVLTYDTNGNLQNDGTRSYAYDAENRLITVTQGGSVWNYKYDYLGRRIEKSGTGIVTTRYLYDDWNLIAELDGTGTITRRFVWGLDVSGSFQGAGGVGGLLVIDANLSSTSQYYPIYDASHNVLGLYDGNGNVAAAYQYDPFGNLQLAAGSYSAANPFLSATKYTDAETGLVYYGMRFYSPTMGRFINRDPIEEAGGINLYAFCGNDGVNHADLLGMSLLDWFKDVFAPSSDSNSDDDTAEIEVDGGQSYTPGSVVATVSRTTGERTITAVDPNTGERKDLAGTVTTGSEVKAANEAWDKIMQGELTRTLDAPSNTGTANASAPNNGAPAKPSPQDVISYIDKYIADNPGKPVPIGADQVDALMLTDVSKAKSVGYDKMTQSKFRRAIKGDLGPLGDGTFYRYRGNQFQVDNALGLTGQYRGSDINYYYQGFANAARDDGFSSKAIMVERIRAWNIGEFLIGEDLHWGIDQFNTNQLRQIGPAVDWATRGFDYYNEHK